MRGIAYTRISEDDERSVSLDYQEAAVREYVKRQGIELVRTETDNGISGKSIKNRPGVQRILQAVDAQEIDCVLVYRSDRLSRDGLETLQIENLMRKRGVAYLSVTEGNLTGDSVDDEFLAFIRAGLNQRERKLISLRTKAALQRKRQKGERLGRPRYGWTVKDGELIPVPEEQAVIERVMSLRAKGHSTREIARTLTADGIRIGQTQITRILRAA